MTRLIRALLATALAVSGLIYVNQTPASATPALIQTQVATTVSTASGQSVTLTNLHAGDVLFAWSDVSVQASTNQIYWHNTINDSASLGWHNGITGGANPGFEPWEAYWLPTSSHTMVRGLWANVPADIPSLTVYQDFSVPEPAATLIVSAWSGVAPQVSRRNLEGCVGSGAPSNSTKCDFPTTTAPGVRIFCSAWEAPATGTTNGASNWPTVGTTDTYGARCTYKVATTTGAALHPEVDYSQTTNNIGYGYILYS